ncbi:MAG: ScbR family autoregulator-binding transcription factor [Dermatophilaceae bacterium]
MPQQQRAIDTRRNALRGAAIVIERRGFKVATIAEMVAESGITKGALYFHFSSKEAIAEAIIAEQGEWFARQETEGSSPMQMIVDLSYAFAEALLHDPLMRASVRMTIDRAASRESTQRGYLSWVTGVTTLLDRARRAGTLAPGTKPAEVAYIVTSAVTGLQITSDALTDRQDLAQRLEDFWRLLVPAVVRPELVAKVDLRPPARRRRTVANPV